jgi:hypothetical protein
MSNDTIETKTNIDFNEGFKKVEFETFLPKKIYDFLIKNNEKSVAIQYCQECISMRIIIYCEKQKNH